MEFFVRGERHSRRSPQNQPSFVKHPVFYSRVDIYQAETIPFPAKYMESIKIHQPLKNLEHVAEV